MPENRSECLVRRIFTHRLGFTATKIPEAPPSRTADFEFSLGRQLRFVAEVKNLTEHDVPTYTVPGTPLMALPRLYMRNDNGPSRVSRRIVDAADQLKAYTCPKVLVLVNDESQMSFREDFRPGFLGYDQIGTTWDGSPEVAWLAPRGLLRDLRQARTLIDLYVWVEGRPDDDGRDLWFASTNQVGWQIGQRFLRDNVIRPRAA